MDANGLFELFNVLGSAFAKGSLGLSVPLLAFLGGGIDLQGAGVSIRLHKLNWYVFCFWRGVASVTGRKSLRAHARDQMCLVGELRKDNGMAAEAKVGGHTFAAW